MPTDTQDQPFQIRSLLGSAGVGSNGEKLVSALAHMYPAELTAAQEKRPNVELSAGLDLGKVSVIAGQVDVRDAVVRGGELRDEDAWVTYAGYDQAGDTVKGAFPFPDLARGSSKLHVSQTDRLQGSEAARDFRLAQAKDAAAAERERVSADPIASYEEMLAAEVVAYMEANPDRAKVVKALERATRPGDERKTVMEWQPPKPDPAKPAQG